LGSVGLNLHLHKSVWDGDIIPQSTTASQHCNKRNALDEERSLRRLNNQSHSQTNQTPTKKRRLKQPRNSEDLYSQQTSKQRLQRALIEAYDIHMRSTKQTWNKPFYQRYDKLPKILTEEKLNMIIFPTTSETISNLYRRLRNKLAQNLQDPTIKQIRLYDFRHFKATMEYHKTKDLLHVKALLGHKDLRTTLRYTQLLESLNNDEYHCKAAANLKEASQLIENGFEYVTEIDGLKLFRKRK